MKIYGRQISKEIKECIDWLVNDGLTISQINLDKLEKDFDWWQDVEMTCVFYVDSHE